jgi:Tol biopolymer transport system component
MVVRGQVGRLPDTGDQGPRARDAALPQAEPTLSPDGKWVAYISDESGRNEVYVRPFEGAQGKWAVSTTGGSHPVWSRNERQLFYGSADGINVVNFTSSGQTFSAGKPQVWSNKTVEDFDMAPDGKRYIVIQKETPVQQGPAQLTFLVNFFGELRRRVDAAQ